MNGEELKTHIREYYGTLFDREKRHSLPIKTGRALAEELGYPLEILDGVIPVTSTYWDWFVPCGNLPAHVRPRPGDRLLNLGCGAAVDSFAILAGRGSSESRPVAPVAIVNMDVVFSILYKARDCGSLAGLPAEALLWACGDGNALPFRERSFDWVLMNGVFNLFSDKVEVLDEVLRVMKPGGRLAAADLCSTGPLPDYFGEEPDAWAWCMSGSRTESDLSAMLENAGFVQVRLSREETGDMFHRVVFTAEKR